MKITVFSTVNESIFKNYLDCLIVFKSDLEINNIFFFFFFLSGFSFTDTDNSQDSRGREGTFLYSTLPLPPAHEH